MNDPDLESTCAFGNIWSLFHRAWAQAQAGSEYDKDVFRELEKKILRLQGTARANQEILDKASAVCKWIAWVPDTFAVQPAIEELKAALETHTGKTIETY